MYRRRRDDSPARATRDRIARRPRSAASAIIAAMHQRLSATFIAAALLIVGCHSPNRTTTTTSETTTSTPGSVDPTSLAAADHIAAIQSARTPAAEADAIRALRQWEIDNRLTYRIHSVRTDTNTPVPDPSALGAGVPVRTEVTLFRGRDPIRTFQFTPKDKANLALFGE